EDVEGVGPPRDALVDRHVGHDGVHEAQAGHDLHPLGVGEHGSAALHPGERLVGRDADDEAVAAGPRSSKEVEVADEAHVETTRHVPHLAIDRFTHHVLPTSEVPLEPSDSARHPSRRPSRSVAVAATLAVAVREMRKYRVWTCIHTPWYPGGS